ncbi:TcfC E-set like domain-containing protein, partial [Vibrio parahaemolyticus]|uniref:TcfC E-set like domain-containing protein n=1 Tax=Vibrio parahaemolyticus TaxID=670 RepID=UPI0011242E5B
MNITNRNWCISGVKLGVLLYIGLYSCISFGGYVPKEFEHFYQFKEKKVLFLLPNDYSSKVNVIANFNTIKTIIDNEKLRNAMLEADISKSSLDKVISCITNSGDCEGIDYFYDSQKEDVSVKVSAKLMSTKKQKYSFSHVEPSESAWISTNRLYLGKYDSSLNGAVSSDNLIGLGKGHFSINGSFSPSSSRLERAGYVYDFSGYGLDVSYNLEPLTISNSTSQFDFSSPYEQYGVSLFTSDNLLNKSVDDYGRIYFDMQQSGTVEIWRNGENIYSNSYSSGQHSISYRELPEGNYFVKVIVKAGRLAPKEYLHKVNNTRRKTSVRGYDYNIGFYSALSKDKQQNKNEVKYFSLSGTKALFDNELMLSIGSNIDNDNYHAEIGGKYVNNDLDMFISYNYLRDGGFINSGINYGGFSFETERLYLDKSDLSKLTEVLYQDGEYHQLSLSYSMNVMGGYFSVYGIRYVAEADFYEDLIGTDTMSINYSRFIFNNINLNVGYEVNKGTGDNSIVNNRVYMELNIPLNDDISYSYRQDYSPNRKFSYANTLSYDIQKDADLNTNLSINQTIDKDLSDVYLGLSTDIKN